MASDDLSPTLASLVGQLERLGPVGAALEVVRLVHEMAEGKPVSQRMQQMSALVADYAALAEGLDRRPQDRVKIFDLEGQPIGFGLKDGQDERGTMIEVADDAVGVAGRAEGPDSGQTCRREGATTMSKLNPPCRESASALVSGIRDGFFGEVELEFGVRSELFIQWVLGEAFH